MKSGAIKKLFNENPNRIPIYCAVTILYWFSLYTFVPTLSTYAISLGATGKMTGLILGSYGFVQMVLRIPLGIYSDTINKRKIFLSLGLLFSLAGAVTMYFTRNPAMLLIGRGLTGVAAATWVAYTVLFSSYFKHDQATKAMGFANSLNSIGQMGAILVGGYLAMSISPQAPFALAAIIAIVGFAMSFRVVENRDLNRKPLKAADFKEVIKNKELMTAAVIAILIQFLVFGTLYGFSPVMIKSMGGTQSTQGLITTLGTLPSIFAAALSGSYFRKKFGIPVSLTAGMLMIAITILFLPSSPNLVVFTILQMIGGFGRGLAFSLTMGLGIQNVRQELRATAMGFFQAVYGIGITLGPVAAGFLKDAYSLNTAFIVLGILGVLGTVIAYFYMKKIKLS